jgi:transcriptional regulator with XRE-family HTH domain
MQESEASTMRAGIYSSNFSEAFTRLLKKTRVSCYKIAQYSHLDEGYLSRLRNGRKRNPSIESVVLIALAFVHYSKEITIEDVEELLHSTIPSLLTKS